MAKSFLDWHGINSNIKKSLQWEEAEATLLDYQTVDANNSGLGKFRNGQKYYAFATFDLQGKTIGVQRISFYPKNHIINSDFFNEIPENKKIIVKYDKENPHESVMLCPESHEQGINNAKFIFFEAFCSLMIALALSI